MKIVSKLVEQTVVPTRVPTNRIVVVDCSGSMYSELPKLRTHLKNKLPTMVHPEDSLSLLWFSGRGQFGTIFKNLQIANVQDLTSVHTAIDRFLTPQGLTGFKEPLEEVESIIAEGNHDSYTLSFMTDGGDNCWTKNQIIEVCARLGTKLSSAAFVEYGYYADHSTIVQMAEATGGSVVLAENFQRYSEEIDASTRGEVRKNRLVVQVEPCEFVVGVTTTGIVMAVPKSGQVSLPGNVTEYGYLSGTGAISKVESREFGAAMVAALIQRGQADLALELASVIGDRGLFSKIENSFSKQDYARAVEYATACSTGDLVLGKPEKLKVSPNAYNALALLMDLAYTEGNFLHLSHPEFKYNRIGGARTASPDLDFVPKFIDSAVDVKAPISTLKFDSDRPNVSILVRREGSATLPPNEFFGDSISTFIWRNYTIIRDGIVNVSKLPVVLTRATYDVLANQKVITEPYELGRTYVIDMTRLPVINRAMVSKKSSSEIFDLEFEIYKLQSAQKYVKTFIEKLELSTEYVSKYGVEATEFLKKYGITPRGFDVPAGPVIAVDSYTAKVLEIKMSGLSGIPKIEDVKKAINAGKTLTPSQQVMAKVIAQYGELSSTEAKAEFNKIKEQLSVARYSMVQAKFGVILGKSWFTDMESYEDNTRELDFDLGKPIKCQVILSDKEV